MELWRKLTHCGMLPHETVWGRIFVQVSSVVREGGGGHTVSQERSVSLSTHYTKFILRLLAKEL